MADIEATTWHAVDASNTDVNPLGWGAGQLPSAVLLTGRAMMGAGKREFDRTHYTLTSAGTSTALTLTPSPAIAGLLNGQMYGFIAGTTCIAGATLNVNAKGAKALKQMGPGGIVAVFVGAFLAGDYVEVVYNLSADAYIIVSPLSQNISFSATKGTTDQTGILPSTATKITFTTEDWDLGGYYDAPNSKFTPPAGKYLITACLAWLGNVVDQNGYVIRVFKNGVTVNIATVESSGTGTTSTAISVMVSANGTDYFEIYGSGAGAGNKTVLGAVESTFFQAHRVG